MKGQQTKFDLKMNISLKYNDDIWLNSLDKMIVSLSVWGSE